VSASRLPALPVPGGFGFPIGFLAAVAVTFAAVAAHATAHPLWSLIALCAVTGVLACVTTLPASVATAAVAWGLHAGFVLGRHGDLVFTSTSARDALVLAAVTVVSFATAAAARTAGARGFLAHNAAAWVQWFADLASFLAGPVGAPRDSAVPTRRRGSR
jgi:hypothetical protein